MPIDHWMLNRHNKLSHESCQREDMRKRQQLRNHCSIRSTRHCCKSQSVLATRNAELIRANHYSTVAQSGSCLPRASYHAPQRIHPHARSPFAHSPVLHASNPRIAQGYYFRQLSTFKTRTVTVLRIMGIEAGPMGTRTRDIPRQLEVQNFSEFPRSSYFQLRFERSCRVLTLRLA